MKMYRPLAIGTFCRLAIEWPDTTSRIAKYFALSKNGSRSLRGFGGEEIRPGPAAACSPPASAVTVPVAVPVERAVALPAAVSVERAVAVPVVPGAVPVEEAV